MAHPSPGNPVADRLGGPAETDVQIDAYLAAIAARLTSRGLAGPRRARQAIITELRDGLWEATTAHLEQGQHPQQAAHAALQEFGDPATVASAFTPELAGLQARRTALTLTHTGPLVGLLWIAALAAIHAHPPCGTSRPGCGWRSRWSASGSPPPRSAPS
jgi:hypothetical protein